MPRVYIYIYLCTSTPVIPVYNVSTYSTWSASEPHKTASMRTCSNTLLYLYCCAATYLVLLNRDAPVTTMVCTAATTSPLFLRSTCNSYMHRLAVPVREYRFSPWISSEAVCNTSQKQCTRQIDHVHDLRGSKSSRSFPTVVRCCARSVY